MTKQLYYKKPGQFEETRYEKIHNTIFDNRTNASKQVALEIAELIQKNNKANKKTILGLATGSSPIKVYEELVRLHKEEKLSFKNVISFNLDEYYGIMPEDINSYHYFMNEYLFKHVDIKSENVHIPNGNVSLDNYKEFCVSYEEQIREAGGLDFQLLGIGRTGHIGFNEPGSHKNSRTRLITLNHITRVDAAPAFKGINNVPRKAITMGIASIMQAKRIVLLAWGSKKAEIVKKTIEGKISSDIPATYLQNHPNTTFVLDEDAAHKLTRIDTPWVVKDVQWNKQLKKKAVVWLSNKVQKSVLKLTDKDYNENSLADLIAVEGNSYDLNISIFNALQHTITGWPGGKPNADDSNRPERATPAQKRVIVFSPHPDDDVISMGGTLDRLIAQGHDVHVVYQTSGSNAVTDEDTLKFLEVYHYLYPNQKEIANLIDFVNQKDKTQTDIPDLRKIKAFIRRSEAINAVKSLELTKEKIHFLDLPFYDKGPVLKRTIGKDDIDIMKNIINKIQPHQIFAAGDLADPHGTHRITFDLLKVVLSEIKNEKYIKNTRVWLYRGAWDDFETYEIEMAVPMSPAQMQKKIHAIFYHQTQKDNVMFKGEDSREFWQRVEQRNMELAQKYNKLGLADYEAIESFKQLKF
jgi:glucosamine-6-phosphate deaminase